MLVKPPFESTSIMSTGRSLKQTSTDNCRVPMTTGCKIFSTEHAEALHEAQTVLVLLNLLSITIIDNHTC